MKRIALFSIVLACVVVAAHADDEIMTLPMPAGEVPVIAVEDIPATTPTVRDRPDCNAIKAEMDPLAAREDLNDTETKRLSELQTDYRRYCSKRAGARSSAARHAVIQLPAQTATPDTDKQNVADADTPVAPMSFDDAIAAGDKTAELIKSMESNEECARIRYDLFIASDDAARDAAQAKYDAQCGEPQMSAAEYVQLRMEKLEQGLCADDSKPNRFGCCAGEKFKDIGNMTFGCCPDDGGDCFPPIKK